MILALSYTVLIVLHLFLPLHDIVLSCSERVRELEQQCEHYQGHVQAFLERCQELERGGLWGREVREELSLFRPHGSLLLLLVEPLFRLMLFFRRKYIHQRDVRIAAKFERERARTNDPFRRILCGQGTQS